MAKLTRPSIVTPAIILALICYASCFSLGSPNDCTQPRIVEYLNNYTIPTNDLEYLVKNNLSSFNINDIKNKTVTFHQIKGETSYIVGKKVTVLTPLQYEVDNDAFSVKLTWTANVSKTLGKDDTFKIEAEIPSIKLKYIKTYLADKKKFEVSNLTYVFTSDMIVVKSMTPTPNATEKANIEATIKGDLYNSINQQFKSLQGWMNDNAAKQKITDTYEGDTYTYKSLDGSFSLPINVQQMLVVPEGSNIVTGYVGSIDGVAAECPVGVPRVLDGYKMFISQEFAQSFAEAVIERYVPYKNVLVNGSWVRT